MEDTTTSGKYNSLATGSGIGSGSRNCAWIGSVAEVKMDEKERSGSSRAGSTGMTGSGSGRAAATGSVDCEEIEETFTSGIIGVGRDAKTGSVNCEEMEDTFTSGMTGAGIVGMIGWVVWEEIEDTFSSGTSGAEVSG